MKQIPIVALAVSLLASQSSVAAQKLPAPNLTPPTPSGVSKAPAAPTVAPNLTSPGKQSSSTQSKPAEPASKKSAPEDSLDPLLSKPESSSTGSQSTGLSTGTSSTTLQTGTRSTTLQAGTDSTMLQAGTRSQTLQGGTAGTLIHGRAHKRGGPVTILFVVDASLSMKEKLKGKDQKIDAAKKVLQKALARIPTDVNLGLRVFGQFATPGFECRATALLVPPGKGNRRTIINKLRNIRPTGLTPLTYALHQAAENDLKRVRGKKTIILITDGAETCGLDPCAYIRSLPYKGINLKVDIVGLDLRREFRARKQLNCIAKKSGGKYFDADTSAKMIESISRSVSRAIQGRVITGGSEEVKLHNPETPPELVPIVPMKKLESKPPAGSSEKSGNQQEKPAK